MVCILPGVDRIIPCEILNVKSPKYPAGISFNRLGTELFTSLFSWKAVVMSAGYVPLKPVVTMSSLGTLVSCSPGLPILEGGASLGEARFKPTQGLSCLVWGCEVGCANPLLGFDIISASI